MNLDELIKQVEELDKIATKGQWNHDVCGEVHAFIEEEGEVCVLMSNDVGFADNPEYALVAHYRTATPELARACKRMKEALDRIANFEAWNVQVNPGCGSSVDAQSNYKSEIARAALEEKMEPHPALSEKWNLISFNYGEPVKVQLEVMKVIERLEAE